ncbi:MAG TPA: hypothetical protein VJS38_03965 [Phenylobacterium sp.]|uniref:ATP-binding protein n=1 Tax=Phenylobacterium sp. TaxID=1871053 RepID=UPI002B4823EB|nr:hypothetical protein [Phenylobacterium sp.]HKR87308.1 hypothetical protein [Phenylobacterium sp.]
MPLHLFLASPRPTPGGIANGAAKNSFAIDSGRHLATCGCARLLYFKVEIRHGLSVSVNEVRFENAVGAQGSQLRPQGSVLILDAFGGDYFDQLACTLRRRGVRVVRVSSVGALTEKGVRRLTRWMRDQGLYDAYVSLSEVGEDGALPKRLGGGPILDVLAEENTLAAANCEHPAISALARRGLAYRRFPPLRLIDKFEVNAILERAGVLTPPQMRASDISAKEAVARFGLPLVVKAAIGAAGQGVRIGDSLEEVERALEDLNAKSRGGAFYQKYIDGHMVMYGAVTGTEGALLEHGFCVMANCWPLGPSAVVRVFDDPDLLAAGRLVTRTLGCLGLAEIGFIRDRDGKVWHVDANVRVWTPLRMQEDSEKRWCAQVQVLPCVRPD